MTALKGTLAIVALLLGCASARAELAVPSGPVVLTVVGDIANTNRGALDPAVDRLVHHHEQAFESAAVFDRARLEALGMESRQVGLSFQPEAQEIEGPPLAAGLEAVGAGPGPLCVLALDGFQVEITPKDLEAHDWLLGLKRNGRDLGLGDFGPAWLVFSPAADNNVASSEEAEMWPYQVFLIRVGAE
jgi:hypothetical protein